MNFQVMPLDHMAFRHLYGMGDQALAPYGAIPCIADTKPGFPCRVSLRDAEPGERLLLLNFQHQPACNPYQAAHAIFVIDGASSVNPRPGELPDMLAGRRLSVRAFDDNDMMTDAAIAELGHAAPVFQHLLASDRNRYLHVHTAERGCYLAKIERAREIRESE